MVNNLSPSYLSSLVPQPMNAVSAYNLRNLNNIQNVPARSNYYYNSFLPSTIRDWNSLPLGTRNSESLASFKRKLNSRITRTFVPKYHYTGNRKLQVLHTRLRTNFSSLNHDLFLKNITDSTLYRCAGYRKCRTFFHVIPTIP